MTGSASPTVIRWVVVVALTSATAPMYAISLRGNYLYGYGLGQTPEKRELFAWANVAADIWKGFGLVAIVLLWRAHTSMALIASLAWLVCLATGVNSAIGVYVQDRSALTGSREAQHTSYADARKALLQIEERITTLPPHRSVQQVEAAIAALLAKPVHINERLRGTIGSLSSNCMKHDARTTEACADVARLREELATARNAAELEAAANNLRPRLDELRDRGGSLPPDPVGEFWAWATRGLLTVRDAGFGFPLLFALLIEVVSAFGPAVIVAVAGVTRAEHGVPQQAAAGPSLQRQAVALPSEEQVLRWLTDRTEPASESTAVTVDELYADFAAWCASEGRRVLERATFAQELDRVRRMRELSGKIRKFGQRYYGLRLIGMRMLAGK